MRNIKGIIKYQGSFDKEVGDVFESIGGTVVIFFKDGTRHTILGSDAVENQESDDSN